MSQTRYFALTYRRGAETEIEIVACLSRYAAEIHADLTLRGCSLVHAARYPTWRLQSITDASRSDFATYRRAMARP